MEPSTTGLSRGILLLPTSKDPTPAARRLNRKSQLRPASIFHPQEPDALPEWHFPLQTAPRCRHPRFVNRHDSREILLIVDGSCLYNGQKDRVPEGGCSFMFKNSAYPGDGRTSRPSEPAAAPTTGTTLPLLYQDGSFAEMTGKVAFPLEKRGPRGDLLLHTSNRAKLRAVIAALEFCNWSAEGWRRVVILADLEYVVFGATRWLPAWVRQRWRGYGRKRVANRDLWEELQSRIEVLRDHGTEVAFWLVRRGKGIAAAESGLIREVKRAAQEAVLTGYGALEEEFAKLCGIFI